MNLRCCLLFIAVYCTTITTTWAADDTFVMANDPMYYARLFMIQVNKAAAAKDRHAMGRLFAARFIYEGCDGGHHDWTVYMDALFRLGGTGKVLTARADKLFIIFEVQYPSRLQEVMIRQTTLGWMFQRAQEKIC